MADVDLLVLGGGPAGAAAAIVAARAGLRAALVERQAFPRHRPGETLHPGVEPLLRRLAAWPSIDSAAYLRHAGIRVDGADGPRFQPYGADADGPWRGLQAPRADLDRRLLAAAAAHGVDVRQPLSATAPLVRDGRVIGVRVPHGTITARFTVDACGGGHWLARRLGIRLDRLSRRLIARYGYARGTFESPEQSPTLTFDEHGWTWTAQVAHRVCHWTRLTFSGLTPGGWRPEAFRGLAPLGVTGAVDVSWRQAARPAGEGYYLVGDAAAVLDPASSHGVLRALMSGMMAGHLAAEAARGRQSEPAAAAAYRHWLAAWVAHDAVELAAFYRYHLGRWPGLAEVLSAFPTTASDSGSRQREQ